MPVSKRQIIRACKARGWTLQPAALDGMQVALSSNSTHNDNDALQHLLDAVAPSVLQKIVTAAIWTRVVEQAEQEDSDDDNLMIVGRRERERHCSSKQFSDLQVVNAFETPKLSYDVMRKQFRISKETWSLLGNVQDKVDMLSQRYALIQQRILRHDLFRPTDLRGSSVTHKITPIESLLGKRSTTSLLLLGILVQLEEGRYYLEDPTGIVPVSFLQAQPADGFYITEHCILLVEGSFCDNLLHVHRLGHPLLEERPVTLRAIQQQVSHPHYTPATPARAKEAFLVLSDVHLDRPKVLQQLEALFAGYANCSRDNLPCIVLMGNFSSTPTTSYSQLEALLEELQSTLHKFPVLQYAHVVLVPGPGERGPQVLPLPPLKHDHKPNWHWASNPCRIRWAGQEMVVFRHDLLPLLQQNQVLLDDALTEEDAHRRLPHCRLIKTILDQGHLVPVADTPVYWNYDHALSLYPLPTVLVLATSGCDAFFETYGGCDVLHPGSWAQSGAYAVYKAADEDEEDMQDDEKSKSSFTAQLLQVGDF